MMPKPHAFETELAVIHNRSGNSVAIDCGCGVGSDIKYLAENGYKVVGFDVNDDAVSICRKRFENNSDIQITVSSFEGFDPIQCGILIAHNSLYFAEPELFSATWAKFTNSLEKGGVLSVNLMGKKDTWVSSFRMPVSSFTKAEIESLFEGFEVVKFSERDEDGAATVGDKHWHTYSVIAIKH